jgi:hypothetical protein
MSKAKAHPIGGKQYYRAIADFYVVGFRKVKEGEFVTMSPDDVRDLGIADKVLQENTGGK